MERDVFTKTPRSSVKYKATNKGPQEKGALQAEQRKLAHRKTTGGEKPKQGQHRTPQPTPPGGHTANPETKPVEGVQQPTTGPPETGEGKGA